MTSSPDNRSSAFAALLAALLLTVAGAAQAASTGCVPVGAWAMVTTAGPKPVASAELIARLARQSVVLLGESHDSADDHRWQLQTLTELHAARPHMVLAFEMFPRRVQAILDRWVAGEYTEAQFLKAVGWDRVWTTDAQLYLPIFHFARMNRIPMVAMNIERELVQTVSAKGFDGVPADKREGVTKPAAPSDAYIDYLLPIYRAHPAEAAGAKAQSIDRNNVAFRRFVESQQLWDRAMAQSIAGAAARQGSPLVVGILGRGHVEQGFGVPHQLGDLNVKNVSWLLPWRHDTDCKELTAGYADAVFGVAAEAKADTPAERPRLGVRLETAGGELRVMAVDKGSIAESAGIHDGDVIIEAAGETLKEFTQLRAITQRQAPGTWLPLKVRRKNETLDIIAKFPPVKP